MKANQNTQDRNSLAGKQVRDIMINCPKWIDSTITIGHAEKLFTDEHVHMLLLVENQQLVGTLLRTDLHDTPLPRELPAKPFSVLNGRWVRADHDAADLLTWMSSQRIRRLAVVDETLTLKGLVCLKRTGTGFCSDADVQARASTPKVAIQTAAGKLHIDPDQRRFRLSARSCGDLTAEDADQPITPPRENPFG